MRLAAQDQLLVRILDGGQGNGLAAVPPALVFEAGFVRQGINQPRLALGQLPNRSTCLVCEHLAGLLGVLRQQGLDLLMRKISEPQGFGADVKRTAPGDDGIFRGRLNAVVAHVAHPAQDHALGKAPRTIRVTSA